MDEEDTTEETDVKQPKDTPPEPRIKTDDTLHIVGETPFEYDVPAVEEFIELVFGEDVPADGHRLIYAARTNIPKLPTTVKGMKKALRSSRAKAMYFNTASCGFDDEGVLRHKKSLFKALHVLVLDDIGTKIPVADVPDDMPPTYIIESSKGNYQYGYVLADPITDIDHATALCQAASLAGLTDGGGVMATKIVRLPAGVNGKAGAKQSFPVKLVHADGELWEPDKLIERMRCSIDGTPITWSGILSGESPMAKKYHTRSSVHAQTAAGVIDPLLEWFYEEDMVLGDGGGDWVDIECPWSASHSTGNNTAGYAPIGRGDMANVRGFKCFHEHCKGRNIVDLIHWTLSNSDFLHLGVEVGNLNANDYAFDPAQDMVWNIPDGRAWKLSGFRNMHNQPLWVYSRGKDKPDKITAANAWLLSPHRTVVAGAYHSPGSPPLFEKDGKLWVNPYRPPNWSSGKPNMKHVQPFLDFLKYLVPDDDERAYFIQWLSAKAQNPRFRGTGVIMQTQTFGTGRGTLARMVDQIWKGTTIGIEFDTLVRSEGFNGWESSAIVIVGEAKESNALRDTKGAYKAYETLKQRVDTSVVKGMINEKFQPEKYVDICSSFLMFTNHLNAVAVPSEDRRLTVLTNPLKAGTASFFIGIYNWMEAGLFPKVLAEHDQWAWHVWHWLREQPVDLAMLSRPWRTDAKEVMTQVSQSPISKACRALGAYMDTNVLAAIPTSLATKAVTQALMIYDQDMRIRPQAVTASLNEVTAALRIKLTPPNGVPQRLRIRTQVIDEDEIDIPNWSVARNAPASMFNPTTKQRLSGDMAKFDLQALVDVIVDGMQ
ncbi:MAG: hypothetical protein CMQ19_00515 [Gammaproteobacteria bacterium]|jgi:hypothetical protein|nr:hypothetical protein [Gammaproteobacteria bacterium]